jgi:hypothetical protein
MTSRKSSGSMRAESAVEDILRERGIDHERAYVQHLVQNGKRVIEINRSSPNAFDETIAAMRGAADASRLLNRQIARVCTLQDAIDVPCCLAELFRQISTIGDEAA